MSKKNQFNISLRSIIQLVSSYNERKPAFTNYARDFFISDEVKNNNDVLPKLYELAECISDKLIKLIEADNRSDSLNRSARALGTLFLLSPFDEYRAPKVNKRYKPVYRMIVCVRFIDELLFLGKCKVPYLEKNWRGESRFEFKEDMTLYKEMFVKPLIYDILCETAGQEHPQAIKLVKGSEDKPLDEFRLLNDAEREKYTKICNYGASKLLEELLAYRREKKLAGGEKSAQIDMFNAFTKSISKHMRNSNKELGSALKVSQIYASSILPTKHGVKRRQTVDAIKFLLEHVNKQEINSGIAEIFTRMFGMFPQGFGVVSLMNQRLIHSKNSIEKAIVNRLYPDTPTTPHCRIVTRHSEFDRGPQDATVKRDNNMFFPGTYKAHKNKVIGKLLSAKPPGRDQEEFLDEMLPKEWEPYSYFSERENTIWDAINYSQDQIPA